MSPRTSSTRRPSGQPAHSSLSPAPSFRTTTRVGSDCPSGRLSATFAWIRPTASPPINTAGTHLVALASSRDMVRRFRAVSEGPLNTSSRIIHRPASRTAAVPRTASSARRRYRRKRRGFFRTCSPPRRRSSLIEPLPFLSVSRGKNPAVLNHVAAHKQHRHHCGINYSAQYRLPVGDVRGLKGPLCQQELGQQHGQGQRVVPGQGPAQRAAALEHHPSVQGKIQQGGQQPRPQGCGCIEGRPRQVASITP